MNGYVSNIEEASLANGNFRQVLYTAKNCQLVLMSLKPGEDIGEETHDGDQFLRIEKGVGQAILNGNVHELRDGSAIVVPAGVKHNLINTGPTELKLYSLYAPPHHQDKTIHPSKNDALSDDEHFDGKTSE